MDEKYAQNLITLMQVKINELTSKVLQMEAKFLTIQQEKVEEEQSKESK